MYSKARTILAVFAALISATASAGAKIEDPVIIDLDAKEASGSLGSARNSSDDTQFITCAVYAVASFDPVVTCLAKDSEGTRARCNSGSPAYVAIAQAMDSSSFILFDWDDAGRCTFLVVQNDSRDPPLAP